MVIAYQSRPNDTYVTWQTRIMYWTYKRVKAECEANPPCHLGGFTRVLAADQPDALMHEVPTLVVPPLKRRTFK